MSGNNYSFDDISIPQPPILVEGQMVDYLTEKIPVFFNSQYLALLDFVSAVQNAFLIDSDQVNSLDADKITNNTQFTQSVFVGAESKIKLDGLNDLITVTDRQSSPVTRVKIGKLGSGTNEYGVQVIDAGGTIRFQTGTSTFLDGGIISADSITATQIAASTITTTELAANTITADDIAAGTITATELDAGAVTAAKIDVTTLSAIAADLGTITAGTITGGLVQTAASGARVELATTGLNAYKADGTQTVDVNTDGTFRFGPATGNNIAWDNSTLSVSGEIVATGNIVDGAVTVPRITTVTQGSTTATSYAGDATVNVTNCQGGNIIGSIEVKLYIRNDVGSGGNGIAAIQIDGNEFRAPVFVRAGGGLSGLYSNTDNQQVTGTFLDGNPAGSLGSPATQSYTVAAALLDQDGSAWSGGGHIARMQISLVTLETFK